MARLEHDKLLVCTHKAHLFRNRTKVVKGLVRHLHGEGAPKGDSAPQWLITNAIQAKDFGKNAIVVPMRKGAWTDNKAQIGYRGVKALVDWLERVGYVDIYKGYTTCWDEDRGKAETTILSFSQRLVDLLNSVHTNASTKSRSLKDHVVVRERGTKEEKSTRSVPMVKEMRGFLQYYSDFLSGSAIDFFGVPLGRIDIKRVFTDNHTMGGRFYIHGGGIQLVSGVHRLEYIKINGNSVVELDYGSMHASLLYERQDLKRGGRGILRGCLGPEFRPYAVDVREHIEWDEDALREFKEETEQEGYDPMRNLCKMVLLISLNSPTKLGAYGAIYRELKDDWKGAWHERKFIGIKSIDAKSICEAVQKHNDIIGEYFFSDVGISLQAQDSGIADYVLRYFTRKEIPVLPWHDSFLIEECHGEELYKVMQDAWEVIMSQRYYCRIDSK